MKYVNKLASVLLIGMVTLVLSGCSGKPISISSASPKLYEDVKTKGIEVSASASGFQLLLFIPMNINNRQEVVYALLKDKAKGGYITDVKIKESWTYAFIGTVYTTTMTATVYPSM